MDEVGLEDILWDSICGSGLTGRMALLDIFSFSSSGLVTGIRSSPLMLCFISSSGRASLSVAAPASKGSPPSCANCALEFASLLNDLFPFEADFPFEGVVP